MDNYKKLKELFLNQGPLRKRLFNFFVNNPIPRMEMAQKIGISTLTLKRFMENDLDVKAMNLLKIKNYLDRMEHKNAMD